MLDVRQTGGSPLSKAITDKPGLSQNALKKIVRGKRAYLDLALALLINEGFVESRPGPNRSCQHFSLKPFVAGQGTDADADS